MREQGAETTIQRVKLEFGAFRAKSLGGMFLHHLTSVPSPASTTTRPPTGSPVMRPQQAA